MINDKVKIKLEKGSVYLASSIKLNKNIIRDIFKDGTLIGHYYTKNIYDYEIFIGGNGKYEYRFHEFNAHKSFDDYLYKIILKNGFDIYEFDGQPTTKKITLNDISNIKLVKSEEQYDLYRKKKDNRRFKDNMDKELIDVLVNYMRNYKDNINKKYFDYFKKYKINKTMTLYKGIYVSKLFSNELYKKNKKIKLNQSYSLKFNKVSSWTTNYIIALNFATAQLLKDGSRGIGFIIKAYINPKDIVVDTRLLNPEYHFYQANQREVILKPGKYTGKIIKITK